MIYTGEAVQHLRAPAALVTRPLMRIEEELGDQV